MKSETRKAHQLLDSHPALKQLISNKLDLSGYRNSLELMHRSWLPLELLVEAGLAQQDKDPARQSSFGAFLTFCSINYFPRRYALQRDIASLGGVFQDNSDESRPLTSATELVGALYVYFGAQMGGKFIAASVAKRLPEARREFFSATIDDLGAFWSGFREALNESHSSDEEKSEVIKAANSTFETFRFGLTRVGE